MNNFQVRYVIGLAFFLWTNMICAFTLRSGKLLFQDLNCGNFCNAITDVTRGYNHAQVSHLGMAICLHHHCKIIEAIGRNVHLTPLKAFLSRSLDKNHHPRVVVGRLKYKYRKLIPKALKYALSWQGRPYNNDFTFHNNLQSFYCSQLIYDAFMLSNHGHAIFRLHKMAFKNNGRVSPVWKSYFADIHVRIPEGELGTNPGMMSRSDILNIIYHYGKLRHIKLEI